MKKVFLILAACFSLQCVYSESVHAGSIKEVLLDHQEAVAVYLYGSPDIDAVKFKDSQFTKAELPAAKIAIQSTVTVYSPKQNQFVDIVCKSEFAEVSERNFRIIETKCSK